MTGRSVTGRGVIDWADTSLRPLGAADLPSLHAWQNDAELRDLVMGFRGPVQPETTAAWLHGLANQNLQSRVAFGICRGPALVGTVQLHGICWVHRTAMLGLHIGDVGARGRGQGTVAASLLLDYAFNGLDLARVSLQVLARNLPAVQLYERLGFRQEGLLRSAFFLDRRREDVRVYAMLSEDWTRILPRDANRWVGRGCQTLKAA